MGHLASSRPPERYSATFIRALVERIRTAFNFLDESNFPAPGLNASAILQPRTLSTDTLMQGEFHLPLVGLANIFTTTSTTFVDCSPFALWNPLAWGAQSSLWLEVTGGPQTAGTAEFRLVGAAGANIVTLPTSAVGNTRLLVQVTKPSTLQNLSLQMRTTNGAVQAGIRGAKLIVIP